MSNTFSIKSVLRKSIEFYKSNIKDLSIVIVKCCLLTFSIDAIFELIEKYSENYMYLSNAIVIINMIIVCYVAGPLYILITHSIVNTQRISLAFFENMFTKTTVKIFLFDTILILPAMLIGLFIWSKLDINSSSTIMIISAVSIVYLILLIRLSVINTHIITNDEINFKYNWNLTKNNIFNIFNLLLICLMPLSFVSFLYWLLVRLNSSTFSYHDKVIELFNSEYYDKFIDFIFDLTSTYIIAFYVVVFIYTYIHLTKNFPADSNNLSVDQSPIVTPALDHLN